MPPGRHFSCTSCLNSFLLRTWPFDHRYLRRVERVRMRRVLVVGIFLAGTLHVYAAHRLSVSQLEQRLAADMAKHHSDADIAQQLGNFELTERLTDKTLQQI